MDTSLLHGIPDLSPQALGLPEEARHARICVGLSGGVDSSVAALLLKEAGYDVFALFMQNWHDVTGTLHGECEWEEDRSVAEMVARKIGIPFRFVDLSDTYRRQVVDYMFDEYSKGRTPNPDVMCNSRIKFAAFLDAATELGAEYVATGHYCRKARTGWTYRILAGKDPNKDQSYFLCRLTQEQLSRALFPIGEIIKPEVRRLAREGGLPSAGKKDSQGICFVGKVDLPVFLQQKLKARPGKVVEIFPGFYDTLEGYPGYGRHLTVTEDAHRAGEDIVIHTDSAAGGNEPVPENPSDAFLASIASVYRYSPSDGKVIGEHIGAQYYTIGQRKGLNIGGHKDHIFIISIDIGSNTIYVGEGHHHPGLLRRALRIPEEELHWIRRDLEMKDGERRDYLVRIRYRQPLQKAVLHRRAGSLYIVFEEHQRGISPGQFAVWYAPDGEMIGSGVIG